MLISLKNAQIRVVFLSENIQPIRRASSFSSIFSIFYQYMTYFNFILLDGWAHLFGAIICMKFNGFQAFLRKRREKVLFMTLQCSQIRNILLSYNTDQAFIKAHFFGPVYVHNRTLFFIICTSNGCVCT